MYIPTMAFVTYILLLPLLAGLRGQFNPEMLGLTATAAFAVVIFEVLGLKLMCYLLNISNESQLLDLVAYSGYKFVGVIVTMVAGEVLRGMGGGAWVGWTVFLYCFSANALFLVRETSEWEWVLIGCLADARFASCDRSSTCFCLIPLLLRAAGIPGVATPSAGTKRRVGATSSSSTATWCSLSLCGH